MRKKKILWMAAMALLALPLGAFTEMDITRVLLMNDDTNETWAVSGQGYINTNAIDDATYWIHEGDPAPTVLSGADPTIVNLGLLDGNRHTFFAKLWDDDLGNVITPLWQLENCRAGNAATTNFAGRHFIPWSSTAVPRDGAGVEYETVDIQITIVSNWVTRPRPAHWEVVTNIEEVAFYDFAQVATVNMQNTTNSFVISPYYKDGIGAVYFDFVNGWYADNASEIQIQVSTGTNGFGNLSFADETNYSNLVWRTQKFDVFKVQNKTTLSSVSTGVSAFTPAAPNNNFYGNFFYRARAMLNLHEPARFRIWRSKRYTANESPDTTAYIIIDNIVASYPPVEVEIKQYGKYDGTRRGTAVLGMEGTFNVPFPYPGQSLRPWAYYEGKSCPYVETAPEDFVIADPRFYYRWRYLDQVIEEWRSTPMSKSEVSNLVTTARNAVRLGNGPGDIEFYYTLSMTKAPHYEPFDFCVGLAEPYGVGWAEDKTPWTVTQRRDPAEGIIAATQGTDWFVRIREGESDCREVVLIYTKDDPSEEEEETQPTPVSMQMELVDNHAWRAFVEVRAAEKGQRLKYRFMQTLLTAAEGGGFDSTTTSWYVPFTTNNVPPCSALAVEDNAGWAETIMDGSSGHIMIEYNDETHAVSITRGEYQNFNLWTDANRGGYVGHSTDTNSPAMAGVSPQKKAYPESFNDWASKRSDNPLYWEEHFILNSPGDYLEYPFNRFFAQHKTPNGWAAENMMFVGEMYSAAYVTNGMAIQLEGRGKGFITYADKEPMPDGLDTVQFNARAAQFLEFDDFAYYLDGTSDSSYAVAAKLTMSLVGSGNTSRTDISPGSPSVSLVGYYRDTKGCYEARFTRVKDTQIEVALYRWNKSGRKVTANLLTKGMLTISGNNAVMPTGTTAREPVKWPTAYLAIYNGTDATAYTYITVAISKDADDKFPNDITNWPLKLNYTDQTDDRLVKGSYGVGSCDCPAHFGYVAQFAVTKASGDSEVKPQFGTRLSNNDELMNEDNWALPPGRMEMIDPASMSTGWKWMYGIKASMPDQSINLKLAQTGSGNDWADSDFHVAVTSFVTKAYSFSPRLVEEYNIRLCAGGDENDARTDVVLDDIVMTQWHAGSTEDWFPYPAGYTNWVYNQCWVDVIASFSDDRAYYPKTLPDSDEFCYVFTNNCTFTPMVDLELTRALVVGGGGGGGAVMGGGGGGGCVVDARTNIVLRAGQSYTITVGAGGTAVTGNNQNAGGNGGESSLKLGSSTLFSARGGGGGQGWSQQGSAGGNSGGSANRRAILTPAARDGEYGGHKGGDSGNGRGGGGAGAGEDGGNPYHGYTNALHTGSATRDTQTTYSSIGGKGGDGVISDITGVAEYYGGGGGGGIGWTGSGVDQGKGGEGGKGGGGRGSNAKEVNQNTRCAEAGKDYYGGGGGGGTWWDSNNREGNTGGRGGKGVVVLRVASGGKLVTMMPRRAKANETLMIRSPVLEKGISLFSFSYENADPNAVFRLQLATNNFGTANYDAISLALEDSRWIDVTNFTFGTQSSGVCTYYFGLRDTVDNPIKAMVRLLCEPSIVEQVNADSSYASDAKYKYGSVTIKSAIVYDEPSLDDRSWFGWNIRTSDETPLAYLPDPAYNPPGLSGALNFTGQASDAGANFADAEAAATGAYEEHDPFIQSPSIYNGSGIGQVQFRARVMDTNTTIASYVSVYGSNDAQADDEDWTWLGDVKITNRTYATYIGFKTSDNTSPYNTIRLAVKAAKYGRNGDTSQPDGNPPAKPIQRVLIDEVAVTEPIAPGISFTSVAPFRQKLNSSPCKAVPDASSMDEQPLLGESFGVQVEVSLAQLADEVNADSIRVFMAYYVGDSPWGYNVRSTEGDQLGWSNSTSAVFCELERCTDSNMVWRSTYNAGYESSIVPPQQDPGDGRGVVVQYYVWAEFKDVNGTNHVHTVLPSEWQNPSWYYPVDYNQDNGASLDQSKYCPYTILQSVSPKRSWINCLNIFDEKPFAESKKNQFMELAVPSGENMKGWYLRFTEQSLGDSKVFAQLGVGSMQPSKTSVNVYNSYDFLTLQSPATTAAKGYAADGTWFGFQLENDTGANGSFICTDSYAVELIRPNGIIEHQIVFGGTNEWSGYPFWDNYDPGVLRDKLAVRDVGTGADWILAGADENSGTVGVMANHGAVTNDWEKNLAQTPEARNRRRNGTYQTIPANWYLPPLGTNYWIFSYLSGGYITQKSGKEQGDAIRLIVPKGSTTNITYTVEPWHRIATMSSNDVAVSAPPFDTATRTYNLVLSDVSENMNFKVASGVDPKVDALIPPSDPYHDAAVRWLENFGHEGDIILAEFQLKGHNFNDARLSLKEMYWLDIYPFQTNRLVASVQNKSPFEIPVPYDSDETSSLPALTNLRFEVYMMITNRETGEAHAPYTIQGLSNESSADDYNENSQNWTSATYKVTGQIQKPKEKVWRPLCYFVFDRNSFVPQGQPNEFTAEIDVWDPFSSKSPIYTDPDVRWWPYRGNGGGQNIWYKAILNEELKPVRVRILQQTNRLTE